MPGCDFAHAQDDLILRILRRMFIGMFSLDSLLGEGTFSDVAALLFWYRQSVTCQGEDQNPSGISVFSNFISVCYNH